MRGAEHVRNGHCVQPDLARLPGFPTGPVRCGRPHSNRAPPTTHFIAASTWIAWSSHLRVQCRFSPFADGAISVLALSERALPSQTERVPTNEADLPVGPDTSCVITL